MPRKHARLQQAAKIKMELTLLRARSRSPQLQSSARGSYYARLEGELHTWICEGGLCDRNEVALDHFA